MLKFKTFPSCNRLIAFFIEIIKVKFKPTHIAVRTLYGLFLSVGYWNLATAVRTSDRHAEHSFRRYSKI
nr:MAG TPA_asm: hypothetical protein [Caudoviricetes sp.]